MAFLHPRGRQSLVLVFLMGLLGVYLGWRDQWVPSSDIVSYLPQRMIGVWPSFSKVNRDFGFERVILLSLRVPKGEEVTSTRAIRLNHRLTKELKALEGVEEVVGLAGTLSIRKKNGKLVVNRLLPKDIRRYDRKTERQLRDQLRRDPLLFGSLVSPDLRVTLLICLLREKASKERLTGLIRAKVESFRRSEPALSLGMGGLPVVALKLPGAIRQDLLGMVSWLALLLFASLLLLWRSMWAIYWTVQAAFAASLSGMCLHLLLFSRLHVEFLLVPPLLLVVASWWGFFLTPHGRAFDAVKGAQGLFMRRSLLAANLALASGAGAMFFFDIPALSRLGVSLGGSFLCLALIATWSFLKRPSVVINTSANASSSFEVGRASAIFGFRARVVVLLLVMSLLSGIAFLSPDRPLQALFPSRSLMAIGEQLQQQHMGGSLPLFVRFGGDLRDPVWLKLIERTGRRLEQIKGISHPQSVARVLHHVHGLFGRLPRIGDDKRLIASLWMLLEGQAALKTLLRNNGKEGIIQARLDFSRSGFSADIDQSIQQQLKRLPTRYQKVHWRKISTQERQKLMRDRVEWIVEGVDLWWRGRTRAGLERSQKRAIWTLIEQALREIVLNTPPRQLGAFLEAPLRKYLRSEDCDLELSVALQERLFRALIELDQQGKTLTAVATKATLLKTLKGTKAAKDRDGVKYAVRTLGQIFARVQRRAQLEQVSSKLLSLSGGTAVMRGVSAADLGRLQGELAELHNPHWVRYGQGQQQLSVEHVGLHQILLPLSRRVLPFFCFLLIVLLLAAVCAGALLLRVPAQVLSGLLPAVLALFLLLGFMGWAGIPLDLFHMLWVSLLFGLSLFAAFSLGAAGPATWFVARCVFLRGLSLAFCCLPLLFSSLPFIVHLAVLTCVGQLIFLGCFWFFFFEFDGRQTSAA